MTDMLELRVRSGKKPETTNSLPHSQLTQHGPDEIVEKLHEWCFSLAHVVNKASGVAPPGTRALILDSQIEGNSNAFMVGREFAHIHPHPDNGSMHIQLTAEDAREVVEKGWGENHYLVDQGQLPVGLVLVFSPRDDTDLEILKTIVQRSYDYANQN